MFSALAFAALLTAAPPVWWLRTEFSPAPVERAASKASADSLPARLFDSTWSRFSLMSDAMLPEEAAEDLPFMRDYGYAFQKRGDFNADGVPDLAVTGVYADSAGRTGKFVAVLEKRRGTWRKVFLHVAYPGAAFGILQGSGRRIAWMHCLECDHGERLRWNGRRYLLKGIGEEMLQEE